MPKRAPPKSIERAKRIRKSWAEADSQLAAPDLDLATFDEQIAHAEAKDEEILAAEAHLTGLRKARQAARLVVHNSSKRVTDMMRGHHGDDSTEYKIIGGTPMSERTYRRNSGPTASNNNGDANAG